MHLDLMNEKMTYSQFQNSLIRLALRKTFVLKILLISFILQFRTMLNMKRNLILSVSIICLYLISFLGLQAQEIRFISWNIEHLAEENGKGCVPRHDSDYVKLQEFAVGLNADVVALQEVENMAAVARVFPENNWDIILSKRPASRTYSCRGSGFKSTQQRVAIALRKGLIYEDLGSFEELGLKEGYVTEYRFAY